MHPKGSLPLLILHLLSGQPAHGYAIAQQIKQRSSGLLDFKEGTLYPALHGLERRGLVASYQGERDGRVRRYYRLTEAGHTALARERAAWARYTSAVAAVLGEAT